MFSGGTVSRIFLSIQAQDFIEDVTFVKRRGFKWDS